MHRQFLGYGLWHYDLVELLKQWYVAEKIEENQRARVEDGRFSRATRSFQGRTRLLWLPRVAELFCQVLFGEVRIVEAVRGIPVDRRDPVETEDLTGPGNRHLVLGDQKQEHCFQRSALGFGP
jgi:hypothetical protein